MSDTLAASGLAYGETPRGRAATFAAWFGAFLRWTLIALVLGAAGFFGMGLREYADGNGGLWRSARLALEHSLQLVPLAGSPANGREPSDRPRFPAPQVDSSRPPMSFTLRPDGTLRAAGQINEGAALRLQAALDAYGSRVERVSLDSPGGALTDAIAMARILREKRLGAVVETGAVCASSCPLVMAGGTTREAEPGAVIGLHQFYLAPHAQADPARIMSDTQLTAARISRHLESMGVDPTLWLHALATPPEDLHYLSRRELQDYRLTTVPSPLTLN